MTCAICRKPIGAREVWTRNTTGATYHRFACPLVLRPVISAPLPVKALSYPRGEGEVNASPRGRSYRKMPALPSASKS